MLIRDICAHLESIAPLALQESYDNSGLIVGKKDSKVNSVLISLDCTETTIDEAIEKNCNLVISHHPIVFSGLKNFNGANYIQRTVEKAIKNDIAIYAIHTNLDNVLHSGVNSKIGEKLGLQDCKILSPLQDNLLKLATYVPKKNSTALLNSLFAAGAGEIGNYSACSFSTQGFGTFKGNENSKPYVGEIGVQHTEDELKIEVVLHKFQKQFILKTLLENHPYEEVAYEFYPTLNSSQDYGAGLIGLLPKKMTSEEFLSHLKQSMNCDTIRYTAFEDDVKTVALCGGSGSFLLSKAIAQKADAFVTADFKYHQFFDAENQLMICDIGHYESEKFTIELLYDILTEKFTTFAVLKTERDTNPINYYH
jgi:dinuclear metal center YbgI/SA1388 family protein